MHHSARRLLLPLLAVVVASLGATATAASYDGVTVTKQTCSTKWNYTDDSPYGKNVVDLLSTLSGTPMAVDNWWFRNATVGAASGLSMCFADTYPAWESCYYCLTFLMNSTNLPDMCDHSRNVSVVSSHGCLVRYADTPFFGSAAADSGGAELVMSSNVDAFHAADMREARRALLSQLADKAGGDDRRFATGSQGYMAGVIWQVMYGMAQCTRDLPASECTACLVDLLAVMYRDVSVTNKTSTSVMGFSCYLTYQIDEPIHIAGLALPPSPPPPPGPPTGSGAPPPVGNMTTVLIATLAAAAVTLLISVIGV